MKGVVWVLVLLISLQIALAADMTYEEVITQGEPYVFDQGTVYLHTPDVVRSQRVFDIDAVILYDSDYEEAFLNLERQGELLTPFNLDAQDNPENQTYVHSTWKDILDQNTTYTLTFGSGSQSIDFFVQVDPLVIIDRFVEEEVVEQRDLLPSEQEELRQLLREKGYRYSPMEMEQLLEAGQQLIVLVKQKTTEKIFYDDQTARITTTYVIEAQPTEDMNFIEIIEYIPKGIAQHASNLDYEQEPIVLEEDPVVMWHLEDVNEPVVVSYQSDKETNLVGNTIVLASSTKYVETQQGSNFWKIAILFILIPLVALIIIFFAKFEPKK